jgi:predicted metal-dependent enzyme (double-stranded beta helix superfamily)
MTKMTPPPAPHADEWILDNPQMRRFIDAVNATRARESDPSKIVAQIRPDFVQLLADPEWLPPTFQQPSAESGMGGGIGMWLLYRAGDGGLAFSALVVPAGAQTPVHDHLAWGLVGLYKGEQEEEVFTRQDDGRDESRAELALSVRQMLRPGDLYELLPENDIHRVRTTSAETSVSLHLLGNDNGCIWRHRFDPETDSAQPFRSGWLNVECRDGEDS